MQNNTGGIYRASQLGRCSITWSWLKSLLYSQWLRDTNRSSGRVRTNAPHSGQCRYNQKLLWKDEKESGEEGKSWRLSPKLYQRPPDDNDCPLGRDMQSPHRCSSTGSMKRSDWALHTGNGESASNFETQAGTNRNSSRFSEKG